MKVRGRLRAVWLALWLAGAAGCVALGIYGDTPESPHEWWWLPLFLLLAAVSVGVAVRGFGRGVDADGNGVVVRNMFRVRPIPWRDLVAIEFKGVDSEAITNMYYNLIFQRRDGSRVTAEAPGGGVRPGEYLFELRERLFAMRSAALGYHHASADRPSDAASTDTEAAPPAGPSSWVPPPWSGSTDTEAAPAAARSRVKRWGGVVVSVAVALAIAFVPLPDLGSLLGDDETAADSPAVDADAQRVSTTVDDLAVGECFDDGNAEDEVIRQPCTVAHDGEIIGVVTLPGGPYPGDNGVDKAADRACTHDFTKYVGKSFDDSELDLYYWTPTEHLWNDDDRLVVCAAYGPSRDKLTGTIKNSHR
jgi:hypothetical protein